MEDDLRNLKLIFGVDHNQILNLGSKASAGAVICQNAVILPYGHKDKF
jgi:hypothetical protein